MRTLNTIDKGPPATYPLHEACCKTDDLGPFIGTGQFVNVQDEEGNTPLHCAAQFVNIRAVETLLKNGALTELQNNRGETALHSLFTGFTRIPTHELSQILKVFIKYRAHLNFTDNRGQTPLHLACQLADLGTVKMLVDAGAEINPKNQCKRSPLDYARLWACPEIADFLKAKGAKENVLNPSQEYI